MAIEADPTLRTARLTLRPIRMADAPALHGFYTDPEALTYWAFVTPFSQLSQTEDWIAGCLSDARAHLPEYSLVLDQRVIGRVGIWRDTEIGFFLLRDYWGQGYMREALEAFVPFVLRDKGYACLTAEIAPENLASAALLSRLGFVETKRAEKDFWDGEKWMDTAYYRFEPPA